MTMMDAIKASIKDVYDVLGTKTGKTLTTIAAIAAMAAGGLGVYSLKQHNELEQAKPKIELADSVMGETTSIPNKLFSYNPKDNTISVENFSKSDYIKSEDLLAQANSHLGLCNEKVESLEERLRPTPKPTPSSKVASSPKAAAASPSAVSFNPIQVTKQGAEYTLTTDVKGMTPSGKGILYLPGVGKQILDIGPDGKFTYKTDSFDKNNLEGAYFAVDNNPRDKKLDASLVYKAGKPGRPGLFGDLKDLPGIVNPVMKAVVDSYESGKAKFRFDTINQDVAKTEPSTEIELRLDANGDGKIDSDEVFKGPLDGDSNVKPYHAEGVPVPLTSFDGFVGSASLTLFDKEGKIVYKASGKDVFNDGDVSKLKSAAAMPYLDSLELIKTDEGGFVAYTENLPNGLELIVRSGDASFKGEKSAYDTMTELCGDLTKGFKAGVYDGDTLVAEKTYKLGDFSGVKPGVAEAPEAGALGAASEAGALGEGAKIPKSKVSRHLTLTGGNETSLTLGVEAVDKFLRFDAWAKAYLNDKSSARTGYSLRETTEPFDGTYFESDKFRSDNREVERLGALGAGVSKGFFDDSFRLGVGAGAAYNQVNKLHTVGESGQFYRQPESNSRVNVGGPLFGEVTTKDSDRTLEGFLRGSANFPLGGGFSLNAAADVYKNGSEVSAGLGYNVPKSPLSLSLGYDNARNNEGPLNVRKEGVNAGLHFVF